VRRAPSFFSTTYLPISKEVVEGGDEKGYEAGGTDTGSFRVAGSFVMKAKDLR
jgi:hypothetical protein